MNPALPWHAPQWERLHLARRQQRLGHALLLTGPPGLGKGAFARRLAAALLCHTPDDAGEACGQCRSCQLHQAGSHPDYRLIAPEENKTGIGVDQVRTLSQALNLTAQFSGARVALVEPAERMNPASANALLKTLEEPTEGAYLILVTHQASALAATVRSRCQQIAFAAPATEVALGWLRDAGVDDQAPALLAAGGGAPLTALALHQGAAAQWQETLGGLLALCGAGGGSRGGADPVALAASWYKQGAAPRLLIMWRVLAELARWKAGGPDPLLFTAAQRSDLRAWLHTVDWDALFELLDQIRQGLRGAHGGLNPELLLDDFLIGWTRLTRGQRVREA